MTPHLAFKEAPPPPRSHNHACLEKQRLTSKWAHRDPFFTFLAILWENHSSIRTSHFSRCVLTAYCLLFFFFEYLSFSLHDDSIASPGTQVCRVRIFRIRVLQIRVCRIRVCLLNLFHMLTCYSHVSDFCFPTFARSSSSTRSSTLYIVDHVFSPPLGILVTK